MGRKKESTIWANPHPGNSYGASLITISRRTKRRSTPRELQQQQTNQIQVDPHLASLVLGAPQIVNVHLVVRIELERLPEQNIMTPSRVRHGTRAVLFVDTAVFNRTGFQKQ
jgi:hypothetical protein